MRLRVLLALVLPLVAAGCLSGGPLTGEPSPSFEFVTNEGTKVNETTYLGKFVILDLMATWCGPCKLEVAHLREVQRLHGDQVEIISIGTDPSETIADLDRFGVDHGASWPYAIDRDGTLKRTFEMRVIPKLVIIDPEGVVVFERQGEVLPAAVSRVIDPSTAPDAAPTFGWAFAALGLGFLAAFNPYRRTHRDGPGAGPTLAGLGILAALAVLAWPFAGLASTRATYGSIMVGAIALGAAVWWIVRVRHRSKPAPEGTPLQRTSDRAYEMAPHFAGAVVMALAGVGAVGFFAPFVAFFVGAAGGLHVRAGMPEARREMLGLTGLALAGIGLLAFGTRILFTEA